MRTILRRRWVLGATAVCGALALALWIVADRSGAASPVVAAGVERREPDDAEGVRQAPGPVEAARRSLPGATDSEVATALGPWRERGESGFLTGVVQTRAGEPIEGALCEPAPGAPSWGFAPRRPATRAAPVGEVRSDAEGRFRIPLAPGFWTLEVRAAGYGLGRADHVQAGDDRAIVLVPEVEFAVHVRDPRGEPIAGVRLALLDSFRAIDSPPLGTAVTDATGTATLEGIVPGEWYLSLRHPDYQYLLEIVTLPETTRWHEREIELQPGLGVVGRVVTKGDAAPIAGATVRVEAYAKGQSLIAAYTTDADGRFATPHHFTPDEPIAITASAPDHAESSRMVLVRTEADARERVVELALAPGGRHIRGRAVDDDGHGLAGVSVFFMETAPVGRGRESLATGLAQVSPHPERWRAAAASDAAGRFEIAGLVADIEHVVLLTADGLAPAVRWVPVGQPDEDTDLGDVTLAPSGSLWGYARFEEDDQPIPDELVRAQLEIILTESELGSDFDQWRPTSWWRPLDARTADDGGFRIDQVAPGTYGVKLGEVDAGSWWVRAGESVGPIVIRAPRSLFRDAEELGSIHGVVSDDDGALVDGAFVALFREGEGEAPGVTPVSMTTSDFRGRFELRAPPGERYVLRVSSLLGKHLDYREPLGTWRRSRVLDVRLSVDREARDPLVGLVLDPAGFPLAGMLIAIEPPENDYCGCLSFETKTNADGLANVFQLGNKDYRVIARDPLGRYQAVERFPVRPGDYVELVFGE